MPVRTHHSAPKFDGKPQLLSIFFDEVELLAKKCSEDEAGMINWAIRYAPVEEIELWKAQPAAHAANKVWADFKNEIFALYPGSTGDRMHSVATLEILTEKQAAKEMTTSQQFGEYYRAFAKIATFLKDKNRLTDREISSQFLRGLNYSFRQRVRAQLRAENPKHHTDDPYKLSEISAAALFLLSCNAEDLMSSSDASSEPAPIVKKEVFDASSITQQFAPMAGFNMAVLVQELMKQMNLQTPANQNQGTSQNTYNPGFRQYSDRPRSNDCAFCSDPSHYQSSCPKAAEFIQKGLCYRNNEGQIALKNGERVSPRTAPGRNMKERIENWHKNNPSGANSVSTNMVLVTDLPKESNVQEYSWMSAFMLEEDEAPAASAREIEELEILETLVATTQDKINNTRQRVEKGASSGPTTRSKVREVPIKQVESPDKAKAAKVPLAKAPEVIRNTEKPSYVPVTRPEMVKTAAQDMQYKYVTPVEDIRTTARVAQLCLDSEVKLTTKEVFAISPDVRRIIKEQLATKKVAVQGPHRLTNLIEIEDDADEKEAVSTLVAALKEREDSIIVANHSEDLRAIDLTIGGVTVEALLDDGSQIIGMREDIWKKIGSPVRSDHTMVMESANKSTNSTIGLLHDVKATIGGYDFYLQIQVVEDAPYEILLGRPFHALTALDHKHFTDGSSRITMTDPNTGAVLMMPTRARGHKGKKGTNVVGF